MKNLKLFFSLALAALGAQPTFADLVGPYTPDANTLFLLHFDEAAGGSVTTNVGLKGGNFYTVTNTTSGNGLAAPPPVTTLLGFSSYAGFGRAVTATNTDDGAFNGLIGYDANGNGAYDADVQGGPASADAIAMSNLNIGNGGQTPFTLEAIICPSTITAAQNQEIICMDNYTSSRGFQFKITTGGQLQFQFISPSGLSLSPSIPTTGPNAFVPNNWYHVAATYDGTTMRLYWTKLDPSVNAANLIGSANWNVGATYGAVPGPLDIGGENRGSEQESFRGLIDEVRISSVARADNQMQFFSPAVTISVNPASQNIDYGQPVTFSVTASSLTALGYQWRFNSNAIPDATNTSYFIPNVTAANAGYYDVVVTNTSGNAATSSPALLTVGAANFLAHRYSFTADTTDSVGGATGTNFGDAYVSGGALVLDGSSGTYMQLPGGLLHGRRAATFDFWAAYDPIAGNNDRVFDFGNTNGVAGGVGGQPNNYLYFSPHAGTVHRLTGTGSTSEFEQTASASGVLDGQTVHITCVVNPPDHYLAIYTNGVLEVANTNFTIPFASLDDQVAYLGRSLWADLNGDAYLSGSIDEFRIYNGALSAVSVRQSHLLGPDALLSDGPVQLIAQPADTTIPQGLPVTFSGVAIGRSPISYQWFENGAPIPAATNSSYSFIAAFSQNNHTFQLVATNNVDGVDYAAASTNATLTVVIPPTLVWLGANGNLWDTASLNWTNPGAGSLVAYGQFDGALFDDRGSAQPNVDLQQTVTPLSLQVNSTANYTLYSSALNGSLAGSGVLNKNGSGTFVLDVSNNLTGPVTISGGTLQVGNYDSYGSLGSGVVTNNATLSFLRGDTALVVPNVIHGSGTVSFDGPGSVTIAGTNDYTGSTLINSGVLNLQNSSGLGATGAGTTVAYGGQLYVTANVNGAEPLTLNGAGDGNGALRKGGAGATVWTGAINLAGDATIGVDGSATLTLSNTVSGNAALTAAGNGTLALNVANTYTGGTTLAGPVVNVNAAGALGNGLITVNGNGRFVLASGLTLANPVMANIVSPGVATGLLMVNDNTNGTVTTISGALTFNASAANGGNFFGPTSSGYLNVTAPITNNATGVVSSRNGFVRLSGGGDYTSFILNQGTLSLGANNGLCPNAALTIANSGSATFDLNGFNQTLTGLADGATNPELVTNSAAALSTLTLNLSFGSTYSGALAGNLALVVNGSASLNLTGTNAYTGNTTVNGGLLEIARPTLSARSTVTVANGALLQLDFLETNTVAGLVLNGVSQPPGVYNSATSSSYLTGVGSLLVSAVAMNPTNITATVSGGNLVLNWPADHTGWRLQAQTNSLATGLGTNWVDVPNSTGVNAVTNAINPINGAVFYRLVSP